MSRFELTRTQARAIDEAAINKHGIPGLTLMENASRAVVGEAITMLDHDVPGRSVLVLCGGGNNGGDGFAVSRMLHDAGAKITIVTLRPLESYTGDSLTNLERCQAMGMVIADATDSPINTLRQLDPHEMIIDAIMGTGLSSTVRRPLDKVIDWINHQRAMVLSVDIPSGLDCDTGKALGTAVEADSTVTFIATKVGFAKANAGRHTGRVIVADIGTPPHLLEQA